MIKIRQYFIHKYIIKKTVLHIPTCLLKQLRKESRKKKLRLEQIRTHVFCDAGALLYQLSYQTNRELVIL